MISCAYHNKTSDLTTDQKIQNSIFLAEFNQKWNEGLVKLVQKCIEGIERDLPGEAEPKNVENFSNQQVLKERKEMKESKYILENCESKYSDVYEHGNVIAVKKSQRKCNGHRQQSYPEISCTALGVSTKKILSFLSFGIRDLLIIEKEFIEHRKREDLKYKTQKIIDAKKAHEKWLLRKQLVQKQLQGHVLKETLKDNIPAFEKYPHLFMSSRLHSNKHRSQVFIKTAAPKVWISRKVERNDGPSLVTVNWSSHNELVGSDFFIISLVMEEDESTSKIWRDPSKSGAEKVLKKELELCPHSSYWIRVRLYTSTGASSESCLMIPSKPCPPSAPIVLNASSSSVRISWANSDYSINSAMVNNEMYTIEMCIDDEKDEWIDIWKGKHHEATLNGLTPDSGYKIRARLTNAEGWCSAPGKASIVYTIPNRPNPIHLLEGKDSAGKDYIELSWDKLNHIDKGIDVSSISVRKCFRCIDKANRGWIEEKEFKTLLIEMGIIKSDFDCEQYLKNSSSLVNEGNVHLDEFITWWKSHKSFKVYQKQDKCESDPNIVYDGTKNVVKIQNLIEDTMYTYTISCETARGKSVESKAIQILTRPRRANLIIPIQVDYDSILLKIIFRKGCKIKVEKCEEEGSKSRQGDLVWTTIYEGSNDIIKATSLRSDRDYQFRCQCVNKEGKCSDFIFSDTVRTDTSRFFLNTTTINEAFMIDCTNAITSGDLILFSELVGDNCIQKRKGKRKDGAFDERSVIARVMNIKTTKTRPEGLLSMEVIWAWSNDNSNSDRSEGDRTRKGTMIERDLITLSTYEVLRMPWANEANRI